MNERTLTLSNHTRGTRIHTIIYSYMYTRMLIGIRYRKMKGFSQGEEGRIIPTHTNLVYHHLVFGDDFRASLDNPSFVGDDKMGKNYRRLHGALTIPFFRCQFCRGFTPLEFFAG